MIPTGVAGTNLGSPWYRRAAFSGWKPSTSFAGSRRRTAASSSSWSGKGDWTRIPSMPASSFSSPTRRSSSSCEVSAGSRWSIDRMPTSWAASCLRRT